MKAIPNYITLSRIVLSIALFFVMPFGLAFYVIYTLCITSDVLDGFIARKTKSTSNLGAKLDSVADMILFGVLFAFLYSEITLTVEIILWIIFIVVIRLISMLVVLKKYKTFAVLHTLGNKAAGFIVFILPYFMPYIQLTVLIYICCFVASISAIEELIIHLKSSELHIDRRTIFLK